MTVGELHDLLFDFPLSAELVVASWDGRGEPVQLIFVRYDSEANSVILKEDE